LHLQGKVEEATPECESFQISTQGIHMYQYIGIDISKPTLDAYDGHKSYKFSNDTKGFKAIKNLQTSAKELCLIFEPTGIYYHDLVHFCHQHNIKAALVGSFEARNYARSTKERSKTDKIDAKVLYRYHRELDAEKITVPFLDKEALALTQRRNVLLKLQGYVGMFRNLLEATSPEDKALIRRIKKNIRSFEKEVDALEEEIKQMILSIEANQKHFENLQTIQGVGTKAALAFLLEVARYPHATTKQMTALMGLDPVFKESGAYKGKIRISKQGGKHLRKALYMPAVVAIRYNQRLKDFYERLVAQGKPKRVALLAVMRKMLTYMMAIIRTGEPYRIAG
jgi:transposase